MGERGYGWLPYEYVLRSLAVDWWSLLKAEWVNTGYFGLNFTNMTKTVQLGKEQNGSQVKLKIGDELAISLHGNPTTGYMWEVDRVDAAILQQAAPAEFHPQSELLGAPGVIILYFKAVHAGETSLELVYRRGWEKNTPPLDRYVIALTVV